MDTGEPHKRVLVVDDEVNLCRALSMMLSHAGYQVDCANTVGDAVEAVRNTPPDVMLLDIRLGEGSGYDVCEAVRADPLYNNVRILMMSALCRDTVIEKAMSMGADDYLRKPFDTSELRARVASLAGEGVGV